MNRDEIQETVVMDETAEMEEEYTDDSDIEEINFDTVVNTRIENMRTMFTAAELKQTNKSRHYIVRDSTDEFYYLKVNVYDNEPEFLYSLDYFNNLKTFTQQLAQTKKDVLRILNVRLTREDNYYEIIVISDYGESDCIDIEKIEELHIIRFLKNLCILLKDAMSVYDLYHSNLSIDNIILVENELKISGFKPRFLDKDIEYTSWKLDLAQKYGFYRLDLFMIGLLWLKLLNKDLEEITEKNQTLDNMYPKIQAFKDTLQNVNNFQLIEMLLDLQNHPNLKIENVILEFDQWIIIVIKKQEELVSSDQGDTHSHNKDLDSNGAFVQMSRDTREYGYAQDQPQGEFAENGAENSNQKIKKNLSNNLTRSKTDLSGTKNVFTELGTETEGNDTPNASKSIIKINNNGNISLAGDENSILGNRLNETYDSGDEKNSKNNGNSDVLRTKSATYNKKEYPNKILTEEFAGSEVRGKTNSTAAGVLKTESGKFENDFQPNKLVTVETMDQTEVRREVIYDHKTKVVSDMTDEAGNTNRNSDNTNNDARKPAIDKGDLMESGFRRETFGPGEGRDITSNQNSSIRKGERNMFGNKFINESMGEVPGTGSNPDIKFSDEPDQNPQKQLEVHRENKFGVVRRSQEQMGLRKVTELDEEKSQEGDMSGTVSPENKTVDIKIVKYERTDSDHDEDVVVVKKGTKGRKAPAKSGSKGKDIKRKDTGTTKREKGKKNGGGKSGGKGKASGKKPSRRGSKVKGVATDKKTKSDSKKKDIGKRRGSKKSPTIKNSVNSKGDLKRKSSNKHQIKNPKSTEDATSKNKSEPGVSEKIEIKKQIETITEENPIQRDENGKMVKTTTTTKTTTTIMTTEKVIKRQVGGDQAAGNQEFEDSRAFNQNPENDQITAGLQGGDSGDFEEVQGDFIAAQNDESDGDPQQNETEKSGQIGESNQLENNFESLGAPAAKDKGSSRDNDFIDQNSENTKPVTQTTHNTTDNVVVVKHKKPGKKTRKTDPKSVIEVGDHELGGNKGNPNKEDVKKKRKRRRSPPAVQKLLESEERKKKRQHADNQNKNSKTVEVKKRKTRPTSKQNNPSGSNEQISPKRKLDYEKNPGPGKTPEKLQFVDPVYPEKKPREQEKYSLDKHKDKDIRPLKFSPQKNLKFNKDKLLESSEPVSLKDVNQTTHKQIPDVPKEFDISGNVGKHAFKKTNKKASNLNKKNEDQSRSPSKTTNNLLNNQPARTYSPLKISRDPYNPNNKKPKSKSRSKNPKSRTREQPKIKKVPKNENPDYSWKNHKNQKNDQPSYKFENPRSRTPKKKNQNGGPKGDPENYSKTVQLKSNNQPGADTFKNPYDKKEYIGENARSATGPLRSKEYRIKLSEIKRPQMKPKTKTMGQLRRDRMRPTPDKKPRRTASELVSQKETPQNKKNSKSLKSSGKNPRSGRASLERSGKINPKTGFNDDIKFRRTPGGRSSPDTIRSRGTDSKHNSGRLNQDFSTFNQNKYLVGSQPKRKQINPPAESIGVDMSQKIQNQLSPNKLQTMGPLEEEFFQDMGEVKDLLRQRQYPKGANRLEEIKDKYKGRAQVEIYKLLAMLSFKSQDYPSAINHITDCLDLVGSQPIPDKKALQRGLIFNLIVVYIQLKNFKGALALIQEMEDFPGVESLARTPAQSKAYLSSLKGDCLLGLKRPAEAAPCFEEYFKALLRKEITQSNIAEMLAVINKIIVSLSDAGDKEAVKDFVKSAIKIFERIVDVTKRQGVKEFITRDFLEKLLLDLMDIFYIKGEYSLLLELLQKSANEKYFGNGSVVPDEQRLKVGHLTVKLANKLRAEPPGRDLLSLKEAVDLLKYGKTLLKKVAPGEERDRLDLLLTFNQGVYHLEMEDFFKSKTLFDKCLDKYPRLMGTTDHKFYRILYNIGLSLYNLKKFEDSLHFFERVHRELIGKNMESLKHKLDEGGAESQEPQAPFPAASQRPEESELLLRVVKILGKIYYRQGKYSECHSVLHAYINKSLEGHELPEGFFKYLTMYYLSCLRLKSTDFHQVFQKVLEVVQDPKNSQFAEAQQYFNLFYQMGKVSLSKSEFPEHEQYKDFLEKLVETRETPEKFISILNLMYSKFAGGDPSQALEMNLDLIKMLRQKDLSISENAQKIENFLFNFLFILVHKLNTAGENSRLGEDAVGLLDQIRAFKEQHRIYDKIYELLRDKEYNSLYSSRQDHGKAPALSDSHLAEAQNQNIQDETLDGTDFTITDAPHTEIAPFSERGAFRVMGPRIPVKAKSETHSEKAQPQKRRTEPRITNREESAGRFTNRDSSNSKKNKNIPNKTSDYDMIYEELISKARVSDTEEKQRFSRSPRRPITRTQKSPPQSNKKPRVSKKHKYGAGSRQPRDSSVEFVKKNNLQRKRCICVGDLAFKWDIVKFIDEFFSNLKSMNFLGLGSEIDKYFQKFIFLIREKNLNWQKFRYVKQLLDFYLEQEILKKSLGNRQSPTSTSSNNNEQIGTSKQGDLDPKVDLILSEMRASEAVMLKNGPKNPSRKVSTLLPDKIARSHFEKLIESIILEVRPCVHDYRLMLVLLESFQNDEYLTIFLNYLHNHHREIASMIFSLLFIEDHERKLAQVYKILFRKIFAKKAYLLKNTWMHNIVKLDSGEARDTIDKATLNSLYIKRRYLWLADPANEGLAKKHVMAQDMLIFKLRFSCYQSLVYLLKFSPHKRSFLFKTHLIHLNSLFPKLQKKALKAQLGNIMHDLLVLAFFAEPDTADNVRDLETALEMLRAECDYVQLYKFSIMTSQLAKGLFRKGLYQEALRFFTKAYYAFKASSDKDRGAFPPFMPRTLPKNFFFNILCFITICNFHLARLEPTIEILKTIGETKFDTDTAYVEMLLMHSLLCLMTEKDEESLEFLERAQSHMDNSSKISKNKRSLFQVFIDQQSIKLIVDGGGDQEAIIGHRLSLAEQMKKLSLN